VSQQQFHSLPEVLTADIFGGRFAPLLFFGRWRASALFHTGSTAMTTRPNNHALQPSHRPQVAIVALVGRVTVIDK